jgi:integrase
MKTTAVKGKPGVRIKENGKFIVFKSFAGKRVTKEFLTLKEAITWKEESNPFDLSVNGKDPALSGQGESRNEIYFRDVAEQYFREGMIGLTEYTIYKKKQRMAKFLPNLYPVKMSEMNGRIILRHLDGMKLLVPEDSRRCNFDKELKDLASIFSWYDKEIVPYPNPVKSKQFEHGRLKRIRKKKKDLPAELVPVMIAHLKEPFRTMATVQFLMGLRVGEVAALNVDTVDFRKGEADISETIVWLKGKPRHEYQTKTGNDQTKPLTPHVEALLLEINKSRPRGCIYFFHHKGRPLRYGHILNNINAALVRANLGHYSGTHILRHSMATLTRKEMGLGAAQAMLGHSTARQTEVYARLDVKSEVREMMAIAERLFATSATVVQPGEAREVI